MKSTDLFAVELYDPFQANIAIQEGKMIQDNVIIAGWIFAQMFHGVTR